MTRQTRLKLRKGFVNAPLTYRVLAVNQLSDKDKKIVTKTLVKVKTEEDAKKLVGPGTKYREPVWGYKPLAYQVDRVGVITYKGIEVAIMYKRVTLMIQPLPEDPAPEGFLENPEDVWIRYDLFGVSVRQQHKIIREELESQETDTSLLQIELDAKDKIIEGLEKQVKSQQTILKKKIQEVIKDPEVNRYVRSTIVNHQTELDKAARKRK